MAIQSAFRSSGTLLSRLSSDANVGCGWIVLASSNTKEKIRDWQIRHMYGIYHHSTCFILPGGLRRLITRGDPSAWTERAWTLQEALAPPIASVLVLFYNHLTNEETWMAHSATSRDKIHPVGPALIGLSLLRGPKVGGGWYPGFER